MAKMWGEKIDRGDTRVKLVRNIGVKYCYERPHSEAVEEGSLVIHLVRRSNFLKLSLALKNGSNTRKYDENVATSKS